MKRRAWIEILVSIVMLIPSGYLFADASAMSLDLLSNPNLDIAIELVRLFWGIAGIVYFIWYLYRNVRLLSQPSTKSRRKHQ